MCLYSMGPFYEKFGFSPMQDEALTPYLRRIKKSSRLLEFVMPKGEYLLFMHKGRA